MGVLAPLALTVGSRSDVGRVRDLNEDTVLARGPVFAVADGMGGHAAGEIASALAIEHLATLAGRKDVTTDDLLDVLDGANAAIVMRSRTDPDSAGMGTTVTGLCLGTVGGSPHWYVFNVGDSRVYRIEHGAAIRLTVDHSEVEELMAAGRISPAQAVTHPLRNVVTRSLGTDPSPAADLWVLPAEPGDVFVVCSDGLTNEVSEADIAAVVTAADDAQQAADTLVARAVDAGGRDNVSVIVIAATTTSVSAGPPPAEVTAPRLRLEDVSDD